MMVKEPNLTNMQLNALEEIEKMTTNFDGKKIVAEKNSSLSLQERIKKATNDCQKNK